MRKRSISDQCLVDRDISFNFRQNIKKSKSEEQLKLFKHGQNNQADSKRKQIINFVKPTSIFRIKKNKNNYQNLPVKLKTVNETGGKQKNQLSMKKKSVVLQAAALLQVDNYSELNERIEFLKVSMMNNLNKLLERDVSLMDLERKADNLTADALNLKMTSNKFLLS
ncbi:hypothetical protein BpHYR1_044513 [Brachionus plicatilis]|uniref:V-SNARE coiled-coil homology domain-containing protein n=1 Tax=Brachionus plicatilis TaxID=10195 RepID=A0A3M7SZI0_BRAPC|nr:hypothetical protein BpHYR1_044513 [Brachionus plicatilis]